MKTQAIQTRNIGRITRVLMVTFGLLGFLYVTLADADDVYNFYFQKGGAPQNVIQGGGGQSTAAKPAPNPETASAPAPVPAPMPEATNSSTQTVATPMEPSSSGHKPFTLGVGYGRIVDPLGSSAAYTFNAQYNFNRFLGFRAQARLRNTKTNKYNQSPFYTDESPDKNKWGGMAAITFTPLRLDLMGHRFIEFSAFAGAETYRKFAMDERPDRYGHYSYGPGKRRVVTGVAPILGVSSLVALNENVGLEITANRSIDSNKTTAISGNIAFQF